MKTRKWLPVSTVLLLALAAAPAAADKPHHGKHEHKSEDPKKDQSDDPKKDRAEEAKKKVRESLMKDVGLSEKKAKDTEAVLSRIAPERRKQFQEISQQRAVLRDLLQKKSNDDVAYGKALNALRNAQRKLVAAKDEQFEELSKILTPKEHAKVLKEMPELQRRLREGAKDTNDGADEKETEF